VPFFSVCGYCSIVGGLVRLFSVLLPLFVPEMISSPLSANVRSGRGADSAIQYTLLIFGRMPNAHWVVRLLSACLCTVIPHHFYVVVVVCCLFS